MGLMDTAYQKSKSDSNFQSNFEDYFPPNQEIVQSVQSAGALTYPNRMYPYQRYQSPYLTRRMFQPEDQYDPSKLAYSITIALELYPGTNVTKEQLNSLKCNSKWEAIRKAWAEFTGKPYIIMPNYKLVQSQSKNNQTRNNVSKQNSSAKTQRYPSQPQQRIKPNPNPNNTTKRYQGGRVIINGKKRNKTIRA
jgi:hypothetical protein